MHIICIQIIELFQQDHIQTARPDVMYFNQNYERKIRISNVEFSTLFLFPLSHTIVTFGPLVMSHASLQIGWEEAVALWLFTMVY